MSRQGTFGKNLVPDSTSPVARPPTAAKVAPAHVASTPAAAGVEVKSTPDAIRKRAYELYMERIAKGRPGDERSDWMQAERELKK